MRVGEHRTSDIEHRTSKAWVRLTSAVLVAVLFCLNLAPAYAGDLVTGYTFSSGEQNVTHTKLNNAVNLATVSTGFYTDKSATTTIADADLLLIYAAGSSAYRKITALNAFTGNRAVITNQTEDTSPAIGDYFLTFDVSDGGLKKVTLNNAIYESAHLIANRTNWNTPAGDNFYLGYNGAWNKSARSNLWYQFWFYHTSMFTNLAAHTAPTNQDQLVVWSSAFGTNRQSTLVGLITNLPAQTGFTGNENFMMAHTGEVKRVTFNAISNFVVTVITNVTVPFTTNGIAISSLPFEAPHGLGATPRFVRWVLVMGASTELGYSAGDEVNAESFIDDNNISAFAYGANSTNVFINAFDETSFSGLNKGGGGSGVCTPGSWTLTCYAGL